MRFTHLFMLFLLAAATASAQEVQEQAPVSPAPVVAQTGNCVVLPGQTAAVPQLSEVLPAATSQPTAATVKDTDAAPSNDRTVDDTNSAAIDSTSSSTPAPCSNPLRAAVSLQPDFARVPQFVPFDPDKESSSAHKKPGIHWGPLIGEEFTWISFMHAKRVIFEPETQRYLSGPYFKDWFYILNHVNLTTWSDGGRWTTNDVFHSMEGGTFAFIYKHNDDRVKELEFDMKNPEYRKGIFKAWLVAAAASTEFEIGPESEATIGHVGLHADAHGMNGTGWTDFIITPFGGVGEMVGEDALDKYVTKRFENHVHNRFAVDTIRILTNPCRSMAAVMEFKRPWTRDSRP